MHVPQPTELVRQAAFDVLSQLRDAGRGLRFDQLRVLKSSSDGTVRRAFRLLLGLGAPIEYSRARNTWSFEGDWEIPVEYLPRQQLINEVRRLMATAPRACEDGAGASTELRDAGGW